MYITCMAFSDIRYQNADWAARSTAEMYCIRGITPGRNGTQLRSCWLIQLEVRVGLEWVVG